MICTKILCRWLQIKLEVFSKDTPDNILWYNCGTKWLWGVYVLHCLENLLRILRILRLLSNLEIVHYTCVTSGLRKYSAHAHCSWYKRWLANCSTKGWRWQDNGDRRWLACQNLSDLFCSLTHEQDRWRTWCHLNCASPFLSDRTFHVLGLRHMMHKPIPSSMNINTQH